MRHALPLLAVLLMGATFAPVPPYRPRPEKQDFSGSWTGNDWGEINLSKNKAGEYEGT